MSFPLLLAAGSADASVVDLDVPQWAWFALVALIGVMLAIDLIAHRGHKDPTPRRALIESCIWVGVGLSFAAFLGVVFGGAATGEYLAGYLIEKSLSVDNVFVWAVIFSSFSIPLRYQHRVLFWGIFGALVLRGVFIMAGVSLIERFDWVLLVFGAFLIFTGIKVVRHRDDEGTHGSERAVSLLGRFMPVSSEFDGHRFFTMRNGRRAATPLLAALVVVEFTDVVFAVDSVPAILAISREPFLVFASNAFAILGMRAAYFLLAGWKEQVHYLSHALGGILVFVGIKMSLANWFHLPTPVSLGVIVALLTVAVVASQVRARRAVDESGAGSSSAEGSEPVELV